MKKGESGRTVFAGAALVALFAAGVAAPDRAANVRELIPLPTPDIFERMLDSARRGDLDAEQAKKSIHFLRPLVDSINRTFNVRIDDELESALATGDHNHAVAVVRRLIVLSIKSLLDESCTPVANRAQATVDIRTAYAEYLVLDPDVRKIDFESSKFVKNAFRMAYVMAGSIDQFVAKCKDIEAILDRLFLASHSGATEANESRARQLDDHHGGYSGNRVSVAMISARSASPTRRSGAALARSQPPSGKARFRDD